MANFRDKMINRVIGTTSERDEREQQEIYAQFTTAFLITYFGLLILAIISLINDFVVQRINIPTIGIFLLFFVVNIFLLIGIRKKKLDENRVYSKEEYQQLLKKHKMSCVLAIVIFSAFMMLFDLIRLYFSHEPIELGILFFKNIIAGLIFGLLAYFLGKSKIIKEYKKE
ncbi:Uncharacterised protein [Staphylococcus petrasii]|uniref:DUF3278 domain-containing protein n=2 Tax=Staphylococcus petrasii TaxID=1276936 RepID=A0A380FY92_9STAP|nr:hypothetical protein [Staphylococcus petrasii]PNZ28900.1 hypothetical protein CD137_06575 [Staphylococcus petrasii]TGE13679.1 hypothetical protein E2557_00885 [Staphylococcus petrasii]TGE18167.1 hypothetical protein BJR09_04355 [Staphylococcus petrasii]SUM42913.1 Uncharacterised protein [Staphylococcus petrasii]